MLSKENSLSGMCAFQPVFIDLDNHFASRFVFGMSSTGSLSARVAVWEKTELMFSIRAFISTFIITSAIYAEHATQQTAWRSAIMICWQIHNFKPVSLLRRMSSTFCRESITDST